MMAWWLSYSIIAQYLLCSSFFSCELEAAVELCSGPKQEVFTRGNFPVVQG